MNLSAEAVATPTESDALTPGEMAYFKSGGNDASGLDAPSPAAPQNGGSSTAPASPSAAPDQAGASPDGQDAADDGEEVIVMGKDGKPRAQNGRFVPHQALHKERERRKGIETELATTRERMARADERLAVLNDILGQADAAAPSKAVSDEPVDPVKDPLGALQQALTTISKLQAEIADRNKAVDERESARTLQTAYQNDAVSYMRDKPEFKEAYGFLIHQRHAELETLGITSVQDRNSMIANEERAMVAQAFQSKRSPAQMLHNLAVARGFRPTGNPPS
ncbi:MAG: hypothetical protein ACRCZI_01010, partial [Cetobacterium sp.]